MLSAAKLAHVQRRGLLGDDSGICEEGRVKALSFQNQVEFCRELPSSAVLGRSGIRESRLGASRSRGITANSQITPHKTYNRGLEGELSWILAFPETEPCRKVVQYPI